MACQNSTSDLVFQGHAYVQGKASGRLIASDLELSFWGGVNPQTGEIIDRHHPLSGHLLQNSVLAIPGGRGSCSGSGIMLELLLNDKGPSAILFERREDILTLGVMISEEVFSKAMPVIMLRPEEFRELLKMDGSSVHVDDGYVSQVAPIGLNGAERVAQLDYANNLGKSVKLSELDRAMLSGIYGEAARISLRIVLRMAELLGAQELMDVTQVHVDGCVYTGPGSLAFAEKLRDLGGQVRVQTTLNSISVDQKRWHAQGIESLFAEAALKLASAYTDMGARPTFTCAPYYLDSAPKFGDQVAWAESNAVVYANSVLGARTMKYPDFLDISIALTGRAPRGRPHIDANRLASLIVRVVCIQKDKRVDDSFFPLLGYHLGTVASSRIPVLIGIEHLQPSKDDLKAFGAAFGAAFATVSSAPMFHIVGITPEAISLEAVASKEAYSHVIDVKLEELSICWDMLNSSPDNQPIGLVSLGNPHFSFNEVKSLAGLCQGRIKNPNVTVMVTCGRATYGLARQAGLLDDLEDFGILFLTDTCWCMISEPTIPVSTKTIMTNSAKYAHYGPGITGRKFYFGGLAECVEVACEGGHIRDRPFWLQDTIGPS